MGVSSTHNDQTFSIEPSGGIILFHTNQFYCSLSNINTISTLIPMQAIPMEMGALAFSEKKEKT